MPLILIPTPIGNMGDITLRALEELKRADLIACEDTRHSGILLKNFGIKKPLLSYQKFNERSRVDEILSRLSRGERVAVVSDAGTPGMSDPGAIVLKAAIDAGFPVDVLPGATAFVPAVLLSGLTPHPFSFIGFLPDTKGERVAELARLKNHPFTMVFYMSPHKAEKQLAEILEIFGDRRAAVVREVSKIYQEARRGTLSTILAGLEGGVKGELSLVVEGAAQEPLREEIWQDAAKKMLERGEPVKKIAEEISSKFDQPKNKIKSWLLSEANARSAY